MCCLYLFLLLLILFQSSNFVLSFVPHQVIFRRFFKISYFVICFISPNNHLLKASTSNKQHCCSHSQLIWRNSSWLKSQVWNTWLNWWLWILHLKCVYVLDIYRKLVNIISRCLSFWKKALSLIIFKWTNFNKSCEFVKPSTCYIFFKRHLWK